MPFGGFPFPRRRKRGVVVPTNIVAVQWLELEAVEAGQWPGLEALLDDAERARAGRYHFERDRLVYIAAHALGRTLLSEWAGGAPQDWRFAVGDHGKPEVAASRLRLNLSHTRGLAAAALTLDHDVGIDVEWLDRKAPTMDLARRFFAPAECVQLEAQPEAAFVETFLAFWTLKEAYVKAIGKGLAQPLDSFAFTLDPLAIRFDAALADDPAGWLFRRFRPSPTHLMALALRHPDPAAVTVQTRRVSVGDLLSPSART